MPIQQMERAGIVIDNLAGLSSAASSSATNEDAYRACYVRDPEGIIVELAEQIG